MEAVMDLTEYQNTHCRVRLATAEQHPSSTIIKNLANSRGQRAIMVPDYARPFYAKVGYRDEKWSYPLRPNCHNGLECTKSLDSLLIVWLELML